MSFASFFDFSAKSSKVQKISIPVTNSARRGIGLLAFPMVFLTHVGGKESVVRRIRHKLRLTDSAHPQKQYKIPQHNRREIGSENKDKR
jgi:hypothetical protein